MVLVATLCWKSRAGCATYIHDYPVTGIDQADSPKADNTDAMTITAMDNALNMTNIRQTLMSDTIALSGPTSSDCSGRITTTAMLRPEYS